MASDDSYGLTGAYIIYGPCGRKLKIIADDGKDPEFGGWEHVSVSGEKNPPNWEEMCFVKDLFWSEDEVVVQFHPRKQDYVNCHPNCLHLWRSLKETFPTPDPVLVGPR